MNHLLINTDISSVVSLNEKSLTARIVRVLRSSICLSLKTQFSKEGFENFIAVIYREKSFRDQDLVAPIPKDLLGF